MKTYVSIEKATGIIRGMAEDLATLKEFIRDAKRKVSDYHLVPLSENDYANWCEGRNIRAREERRALARAAWRRQEAAP